MLSVIVVSVCLPLMPSLSAYRLTWVSLTLDVGISSDFIFLGSKITADGDCSHEIKRRLLLGRKVMTKPDSILKKQRHYFVNKGPSTQGYGFSSVWMWELDY